MENTLVSINDILKNLSITALNEMQVKMQESFPKHPDVLLLSPTGSGKTLGFLLPLLATLDLEQTKVQALILVPSRELALQIESVFKSMRTSFKVNCCYGGHSLKTEKNNLTVPPAVLIGTPGRIADHIDKDTFDTKEIHTIIFDEFDKSLELGFKEEMTYITRNLPSIRRRILTSATKAIEIPEFVGAKDVKELNFLAEVNQSAGLEVKVVISNDVDKLETFLQLIKTVAREGQSIVFCNHRDSVDRVSGHLTQSNISNDSFHGGLDQDQREQVLAKFRNGSINILVTTDLASRGLDISSINHIIHYQKPTTEDIFIHRNGRTARMGKAGTAYILLSTEEPLPDYLTNNVQTLTLPEKGSLPEKPKWATLCLKKGKKDKVNKMDIVGFLSKVGNLTKEEVGLIEVKDYFSYAAVERSRAADVLTSTNGEKIKNKTVKIEIV
jgi:superfamily II DNA/RNA helicase